MRKHAVLGAHLRDWNLPLVGCGLLEHFARRRAALAHVLMRHADAAAAAGGESPPHAITGDALARCGIFPGDLRPVAVEFLGHELAETGQRALAHLGADNANDDGVVLPDYHPGSDFGRAVLGADDVRATERK